MSLPAAGSAPGDASLCVCVCPQNSGIEKAFLFDVVSKIYIATDSSPVDMQSYELCCDMIDVVIDVSCIYGSVPLQRVSSLVHSFEEGGAKWVCVCVERLYRVNSPVYCSI